MELKLQPFDFARAAERAGMSQVAARVQQATAATDHSKSTQVTQPANFQAAFTQALHSVGEAQQMAQRLQQEVQLGNPSVSLEQTMIAMQKAQIGFQSAVQVRNRLVQAYTDVMNMQV